jgi:hypothetical protein
MTKPILPMIAKDQYWIRSERFDELVPEEFRDKVNDLMTSIKNQPTIVNPITGVVMELADDPYIEVTLLPDGVLPSYDFKSWYTSKDVPDDEDVDMKVFLGHAEILFEPGNDHDEPTKEQLENITLALQVIGRLDGNFVKDCIGEYLHGSADVPEGYDLHTLSWLIKDCAYGQNLL